MQHSDTMWRAAVAAQRLARLSACLKLLLALGLLALFGSPVAAPAQSVTASDTASLISAINQVNTGRATTINITQPITLSSELPAIVNSVTIAGNGSTISGNGLYQIFFVGNGSTAIHVAIQNMSLINGAATGGAGGNGSVPNGGGGLGGAGGVGGANNFATTAGGGGGGGGLSAAPTTGDAVGSVGAAGAAGTNLSGGNGSAGGGYAGLYDRCVTEAACWAHARRKFFDVHASNHPKSGSWPLQALFESATPHGQVAVPPA